MAMVVAVPHAQRPTAPPVPPIAAAAAPVDPRVAKLKALVDADVSSPANSGTPLNIVAALAVKRIMEREPCPAR